MKDFNRFLIDIGVEEMKNLLTEANSRAAKMPEVVVNPDSVPGAQIMTMSLSITISVLARYHEWLHKKN